MISKLSKLVINSSCPDNIIDRIEIIELGYYKITHEVPLSVLENPQVVMSMIQEIFEDCEDRVLGIHLKFSDYLMVVYTHGTELFRTDKQMLITAICFLQEMQRDAKCKIKYTLWNNKDVIKLFTDDRYNVDVRYIE